MSLCLSRKEINELTRSPQKARQVSFLRANGIRHYVDAYGWPVVTRAAVEGMMKSEQDAQTWKPRKAS